jgi:hypothetical protein
VLQILQLISFNLSLKITVTTTTIIQVTLYLKVIKMAVNCHQGDMEKAKETLHFKGILKKN